jgi:HEPN domain-containing protein
MSDIDKKIAQRVKEWLDYADEDLRLARHALTLSSSCPYRLIAYHAQQCAEKCLKAYLVYHRVDFPYTHDIAKLLALCAERAVWTNDLIGAERLTPYATTGRYPGRLENVTRREALRSVQLAGRVRDEVRKALRQDGLILRKESDRT